MLPLEPAMSVRKALFTKKLKIVTSFHNSLLGCAAGAKKTNDVYSQIVQQLEHSVENRAEEQGVEIVRDYAGPVTDEQEEELDR